MTNSIFPGGLSPFRTGFLKVALFISGAWIPISMEELGDDGVSISRGRANESTQSGPSSCSFKVKDPTGKWNNRHPASIYYGLIGRGTPIRVQVEMTTGVVLDRWYGEVVTWTPRWGKKGAETAYVEVECAGALRRLNQGASPLRSPLYRELSNLGSNLLAYWPMEDGTLSKQFGAVVGGKPMKIAGSPNLATYTGFLASDPLPSTQNGKYAALMPTYTLAATPSAQVRWMMQIPSGTPNNAVLIRIKTSGTLATVELRYDSGNAFAIEGFDQDGVSAGLGGGWLVGGATNLKQRLSIEMTKSGANVAVTLTRYEVGQAGGFFQSGSFNGVALGRITSIEFNPNGSALGDTIFGHLTVEKAITDLFSVSQQVLSSYSGERADDRMNRLCQENGLTFEYFDFGATCALMGPQRSRQLMDLIREAAATDGGMLYEPRSTVDLGYRTLSTMYSQTPVSVVYQDNMLKPFEPVEDDESTRNLVEVTRDGGSSATVEITDGPLGTAKVGIYDEGLTLSLADDDDAEAQAAWRAHIGTTDEARWPTIGWDLADPRINGNATLRSALLGLGLGSLLEVTDIPDWLPPFPVVQIVQGYTERIAPLSYKIEANCTPGRPYNVVKWDTTQRWSGEGTTAPALDTTQTTFTVTPPTNVAWTHKDGDYDVLIDGEQMTVKDVVGNIFTVVRSVNGVVKSHAAGALITLASPAYWAR